MKVLFLAIFLIVGQTGFAKVHCKSPTEEVRIDPKRKMVEIIQHGETRKLNIVSQNHHAYRLFGDSTYALPGGYVLGLKPLNQKSGQKRLTVFKYGAPVASLDKCRGN